MTPLRLMIGLVLGMAGTLAHAQAIHNFEIYLEAPETVVAGESFTIEAYATVDSPDWIQGDSGFAGFGIDLANITGADGVISISPADIPFLTLGLTKGLVDGSDLRGISGGQLANFIFINPLFNFSNPLLLFEVEINTSLDWNGTIKYAPANPNVNGGLSFYPSETSAVSIIAPNDSDTSLTLNGVTTRVIPAPASLAVIALTLVPHRRRRHRPTRI